MTGLLFKEQNGQGAWGEAPNKKRRVFKVSKSSFPRLLPPLKTEISLPCLVLSFFFLFKVGSARANVSHCVSGEKK